MILTRRCGPLASSTPSGTRATRLFGVHLALIGYLVYRSGFAPRIIGVLLVLAGLGYLIDEIGSVLVSGYSLEISRFSFVGEAVLIFWLLIKGVRLRGSETQRTE